MSSGDCFEFVFHCENEIWGPHVLLRVDTKASLLSITNHSGVLQLSVSMRSLQGISRPRLLLASKAGNSSLASTSVLVFQECDSIRLCGES